MQSAEFSNSWYGHKINERLAAHPEASADAIAKADAIMTAGAFIAEAIQQSIEGHRDDASLCDRLEAIETAIYQHAATTE